MSISIIITAGGIGKRMNANKPKQFIHLGDRTILQRTIECFYQFDQTSQILLTLPHDWISYWEEECERSGFVVPHQIIQGGVERYDSIKNALGYVTGDVVLVHDGVRPFVNHKTIGGVIDMLQTSKAVAPVLKIKHSMRRGDQYDNTAIPRSDFWEVQTPQGFQRDIIESAYELPFSAAITDDATLVEKSGANVVLVEGNEENIKITTPFDLKIAAVMISQMDQTE